VGEPRGHGRGHGRAWGRACLGFRVCARAQVGDKRNWELLGQDM
jgi:hypothetical protein